MFFITGLIQTAPKLSVYICGLERTHCSLFIPYVTTKLPDTGPHGAMTQVDIGGYSFKLVSNDNCQQKR